MQTIIYILPELFLSISILILLLLGVFLKKGFNLINLLSIFTLIFVTIYDFSVFSVVPDLVSYLGSAVIVFGAFLLTLPEIRKSKLVL